MDEPLGWVSGPEWLRAAGHMQVSFRSVMLGEAHSTKHTECIKALEGGKDAAGLLGAAVAGYLLCLYSVT